VTYNGGLFCVAQGGKENGSDQGRAHFGFWTGFVGADDCQIWCKVLS